MRTAHCIICDDIRQEMSGKSIHVGVYGTDMLVAGFPVSLQQLYFIVNVQSPIDEAHVLEKVWVEIPGAENFEPEVPPGPRAEDRKPVHEEFQYWVSQFVFSMRPFVVPEPGTVRVMVQVDGEKIRAGSIRIVDVSEQTVPLVSPQFLAMLGSADHLIAQANEEAQGQIAMQFIRLFSKYVPLPDDLGVNFDEPLIIEIGPNRFQVLASTLLDIESKIEFANIPAETQAEVVTMNEIGFEVQFEPLDQQIKQFDWVAKPPVTSR